MNVPDLLVAWGTPLMITLVITVLIYWLLGKAFANQPNNRLYRQLAYVVLLVFTLIILILVLPFEDHIQGQLLSLFGLVLTAVIGLSSTTFVSNAMAGLMLKAMGSFHTGDFIRVSGHFGRVTTKALLHTEIQSEDRDVITLPNLFVITNPTKVVDQSGTLISTTVSLGFDVHRLRIRRLLEQAAEQAELTDAFVHIDNIGDVAIDYKVAGFLKDVSKLVSKRSELKAKILDTLHEAGVEVMTPNVMNQRPIPGERAVIPVPAPEMPVESGKAERIMFDKAEFAARIERFREQRDALKKELRELQAAGEETNQLEITWREQQVKSLQDIIEKFDAEDG